MAGSCPWRLAAEEPLPGGYMSYGFEIAVARHTWGPGLARSTFPLPAAATLSDAQTPSIPPATCATARSSATGAQKRSAQLSGGLSAPCTRCRPCFGERHRPPQICRHSQFDFRRARTDPKRK